MRTNYWLLLLAVFLSGCSSSLEDKIVDLSGVVFILFVLLFISKQIIPSITKSEKFKRFHSKYILLLFSHRYYFVVPLYLLSLLFLWDGIEAGGIRRISILIGIMIFLLASQIRKLTKQHKLEDQKHYFEQIQLIVVFLVALSSLLFLGTDMFEKF